MYKAFDSAPASINFSEVYTALQTKVVDGQENLLAIIATAKLYEVQKYCSLTNHMWDGFWFLANRRAWERLPENLRTVVAKHVNAAGVKEREDVAQLNAGLQKELTEQGHGHQPPQAGRFSRQAADRRLLRGVEGQVRRRGLVHPREIHRQVELECDGPRPERAGVSSSLICSEILMSTTAEELALSESLGTRAPAAGGSGSSRSMRWRQRSCWASCCCCSRCGLALSVQLSGRVDRRSLLDQFLHLGGDARPAMALDRNEHLRSTLFVNLFSERRRNFIDAFGLVVVATVLVALLPRAVEYTMDEWFITTPALGIPNSSRGRHPVRHRPDVWSW